MVFAERSTFFRFLLHCRGVNSLLYLLSKGNGLNFLSQIAGGGGGGRAGLRPQGVLNKCFYGEAPPRGPTTYPFMYHFSRKRYPFDIPSLELCIPFNCCKCTVF